MSTPFKPPKGQRVCLQYIHTKRDNTQEPVAIVTETVLPGSFSLFLPDGKTWKKQSTKSEPDFDKEVLPLYENR